MVSIPLHCFRVSFPLLQHIYPTSPLFYLKSLHPIPHISVLIACILHIPTLIFCIHTTTGNPVLRIFLIPTLILRILIFIPPIPSLPSPFPYSFSLCSPTLHSGFYRSPPSATNTKWFTEFRKLKSI